MHYKIISYTSHILLVKLLLHHHHPSELDCPRLLLWIVGHLFQFSGVLQTKIDDPVFQLYLFCKVSTLNRWDVEDTHPSKKHEQINLGLI